jgi:hypothetical protein
MKKKEPLDIIKELVEEGLGRLYEGYSGRGMYGKNCYGITTSDPDFLIEEAVSKGLRGACRDNMGKEYIVYWPQVEFIYVPHV